MGKGDYKKEKGTILMENGSPVREGNSGSGGRLADDGKKVEDKDITGKLLMRDGGGGDWRYCGLTGKSWGMAGVEALVREVERCTGNRRQVTDVRKELRRKADSLRVYEGFKNSNREDEWKIRVSC